MKNFNKFNNILGWAVGIFASIIFIITSEPTASLWDCGEYISTSYKLMVGHPPGAPFFQLFGRIFSIFAPEKTEVARMINTMVALSSGFTIMFLFWTITALIKKFFINEDDYANQNISGKMIATLGAGLIGSLTFTFTDSFWFSAVEGEVYGPSTFFTAVVFWAMLKWDAVANTKYHWRWLILISYLIGLSIGVHLLNLLTIPAMVFIYYFRKYTATRKGIIITFILSLIITGIILNVIIPWSLKLAGLFELFFVNTISLPFNSGTIIYFLLLIAGIAYGLKYTKDHRKEIAHVILLSVMFLLIGYSSFTILVIRSNANTVIDENNPDNALNLLAYLGREQYGDWPLLYGQYYNAPLDKNKPYKDGSPVYTKFKDKGEYVVTDSREESIPNYDPAFSTIFPRMYSSQSDHVRGYQQWGKIKGNPVEIVDEEGKSKIINKPTFSENLRFFFTYQCGFMYFRYFMWNFAGRQNDMQGDGNPIEGNWISGIKAIDSMMLGPQDNLPDVLAKNRGRNTLFFLPLILGILGLIYQVNKDPKGSWIVFLLFIFTGLAIIVYLNQTPYQPRERDYAYAASFYAFCIWIGMGVLYLYDLFSKKINPVVSAIASSVICLIVPAVLVSQEWDDHDRSGRYAARDFAINYLQSCAPNAILFTNGDNDTFPLWYVQEVEGVRTDVRVCNLSLLNTDWYITQMKRKAYDSDPVPFSLTEDKIRQGTRDFVYFYPDSSICKPDSFYYLNEMIEFVASDHPNTKLTFSRNSIDYLPTKKFRIKADAMTALSTKTITSDLSTKVQDITWEMKGKYGVQKNDLMVLDLLAHNNWKRPVYFAVSTGAEAYIGLENYFQLEGMAYRLIPVKNNMTDDETGRINTDIMYDNLMNKFKWGNITDPKVYLNQDYLRMMMTNRNNFARLAKQLIKEGKKDKALKVLDRCLEIMPDKIVAYDYFALPLAEAYYEAGNTEKANAIIKRTTEIYQKNLKYYFSFTGKWADKVDYEKQQSLAVLQRIVQLTDFYNIKDLNTNAKSIFETYYSMFR